MCLRWCQNRCRAFVRALSWCPTLRESFLALQALARSKLHTPPANRVCAILSPSSLSSFCSSLVSVSVEQFSQCAGPFRQEKGVNKKPTRSTVTPAYATLNRSLQQTFLNLGR